MTVIYDLIQRFEVVDGLPVLISSNVQVVESGEDLILAACEWLEKNVPTLRKKVTKSYVAFKRPGERKYCLILSQRLDGVSVSHASIYGGVDTNFPYLSQTKAKTKASLIDMLYGIFGE